MIYLLSFSFIIFLAIFSILMFGVFLLISGLIKGFLKPYKGLHSHRHLKRRPRRKRDYYVMIIMGILLILFALYLFSNI